MRKKIMIVEDDQIIRMLLKNILKRMSPEIHVVECENGLEALNKMDTDISLVFSDNNMPVLSGFELVARIKEDNRFKSIPVVMVSVETRKEYIRMGLNKGFSDWIIKPFQPVQIAGCLERFT